MIAHRKILLLFCGTLVTIASTFGQQPIRIDASFEPSAITLSRNSTYKVVIHGSQQSPEGKLPQVNGLGLSQSPRIFRSASFINGVPSVKLEISFTVKPSRVGAFTLPAWSLNIGGKAYEVPATNLRVLPPSEEDILREEARKKQEADFRQALFLELVLPRENLFVGHTILGSIDLYILDRLPVTRLEKLPQKMSDAFSQSEMKQPVEKRNVPRNGKTYIVYSWPLALTAVMEGNHELQYKMGVRVRVRRQNNSPLRDAFLNDPFFGFGHEEAITVVSEKRSLKVRQLPMDGRPISFRGAIGSFSTNTQTDISRAAVGDPVRVTFAVEGKGNFGVMPAPEMPMSDNFKIGPPAFSFEGDKNLKYEGMQKFEYVVTPLRAGRQEIPAVPFSFFDPNGEQYVIAETKPITLRIDPGETWQNPNPVKSALTENRTEEPESKLFQTESDPGEWHDSLTPVAITRSSAFWYSQFVPLLGVFALLGWQFRQGRPTGESRGKKMGRLRQEMKETIRTNDVTGFLKAGRGIIREQVGALVNHDHPEALAADEVLSILHKKEVSSETISKAKELLEAADAREFAAEDDSDIQLKEWFAQVKTLLKRIRSES